MFVILKEPTEKPAEATTESTKHLSKGDKLFDRLVYGWFNNIGTFTLTLVSAHWLKYRGGKEVVAHGSEKLRTILGQVKWGEGNLGQHANTITSTTLLSLGGSAMLLPIKLLENSRKPLVDKLNKALGDTTDPSQLQESPKQNWASLALGRLSAWVMVFGSILGAQKLFGEDNFKKFEDGFAKKVGCDLFGKPTHAIIENGKSIPIVDEKLKIEKYETAHFQYGKLAALDVFATLAATSLLYITSKFFARRHEVKLEKKSQQGFGSNIRPDTVSDAAIPTANTQNTLPSTQISAAKLEKGPMQETAAQPQLS